MQMYTPDQLEAMQEMMGEMGGMDDPYGDPYGDFGMGGDGEF